MNQRMTRKPTYRPLMHAAGIVFTISALWLVFGHQETVHLHFFAPLALLFASFLTLYIASSRFVQWQASLKEENSISTGELTSSGTETDAAEKTRKDPGVLAQEILPTGEALKSPAKMAEQFFINLDKVFPIVQGIFYLLDDSDNTYKPLADYAYYKDTKPESFRLGDTLPGQVAKNQKSIVITDLPDEYLTVISGLGAGKPSTLAIIPVIEKESTIALFELASFTKISPQNLELFESIAKLLVKHLRTNKKNS
jgi:hypothetical protein